MTILLAKTVNFEMKDVLTEIKISALFFKKIDDPLFVNDKCYLPPELQYHVSFFRIYMFSHSHYYYQYLLIKRFHLLFSQGEKSIIKTRKAV